MQQTIALSKKIALFIMMLAVLGIISVKAIDYSFENKIGKSTLDFDQPKKIWGHRGFWKNAEQNSIEAYKAAFELGAPGTELDVFFDVKLQDFIVSHDFPYNLKDGRILTLENVLSEFKSDFKFWLDYKNLGDIPISEQHNSLTRLLSLASKYDTKDNLIIESQNLEALAEFTNKGFTTSYWVTFNETSGRKRYWTELYKLKIGYVFDRFSSISMDYQIYSDQLEKALPNIPTLLFTVNNSSQISKYLKNNDVKIILSDENLYSMQAN